MSNFSKLKVLEFKNRTPRKPGYGIFLDFGVFRVVRFFRIRTTKNSKKNSAISAGNLTITRDQIEAAIRILGWGGSPPDGEQGGGGSLGSIQNKII